MSRLRNDADMLLKIRQDKKSKVKNDTELFC